VNNSANNTKITNLLDPTNPQDAATKAYIDALVAQLQTQITALQTTINNLFPVLTTTATSSITTTTATSGGNFTAAGTSTVTARGVVWSTTTNPTIALTTKTVDGTGTGTFVSSITGLTANTTYYVRAYATNSSGTAYGNQQTFTTVALVLPTLTTTATSSIANTTATSGGNITADGGATVTARGVVYSTTTNPTIALTTKTVDGTGTGAFVSSITGLTANTTYYVRAYATNSVGTSYGSEVSFTTLPTVVAPAATVAIGTQTWTTQNLDVTTYRDGTVIPQVTDPTDWANLTTGAWCYYGNNSASGTTYGKLYNWYAIAGIHDTDPNTPNKTLAPTGYHIPTDAEWTTLTTSLGGESVAGVKMKAITLWTPYAGTTNTNSSGFTGLPGSSRSSNGLFNIGIGEHALWWSSSENNTTTAWDRYLDYSAVGSTRSNSSKTKGSSVRCIAGEAVVAVAPTVTTTAITAITTNTATTGGNVTNDGGATLTARGVVWSTTTNPTIALTTKTIDGTGTGGFVSSITSLTANTTYYVRAYATNSVGTSYGNEVSFTTLPIQAAVPTVTTATTVITATTATTGGNVTNDGGAAVTARGVVWSTTINPTIALSTKTIDGTGMGVFSSSITGLTANTAYYLRAYATNSAGTNYGAEVSFTTFPTVVVPPTTVTIGTQRWTNKNLDVSTYSDGTVIPQVTDPTQWAALQTGAWCYYNNSAANGTIYGKLYNWYAVAGIHDTDPSTPNKKLAPTGYHIPTATEYTTLITTLGGIASAAPKMKATGTTYWQSPNSDATNSSGFTGLPGGRCNGFFLRIRESAHWWTATEFSTTVATSRVLEYDTSFTSTYSYDFAKWLGLSVRCLKD